jgi:hypothetical protein
LRARAYSRAFLFFTFRWFRVEESV